MGKYHILFKRANGVQDEKGKFFPFKIANADVAAQANHRYYIDKITLTGTQADAVAESLDKVECTLNGETVIVANLDQCETFAATGSTGFLQVDVGVLADTGTAIDYTKGSETASVIIRYCDIDEKPGEYV